ncbi:MAG: hypothetical protein DRI57_03280 [Deltaproteobacteria bacterium]|nr:MAG: hypothetical protein DRI57_03280 [Deltaproteobacteria bacterium]
MEISEEIYLVSDDLFRVGNSQSPRLDNVRERDIEIVEREEESVVLPDTGGISAFSKINPRLRGTWWKCPAGTFYPPELRVVCDREREDAETLFDTARLSHDSPTVPGKITGVCRGF